MEDEEMNLFCYNYLCTFILNLSHNFLDLSNNLESDATEPLDFYISNFKETNDNFIINANQLITSIERNKSDLLKRQEDYNKMSEIGEKAQIFLNHLNHKSPNNHWEIDNARAQLDKTKNSTEEALYYYKKQIV